ncbi:MAG: Fic/DOC family N-terminal domain-containing protein [Candidatus Paceibacterota bacterium]
MKKPFKPDNLPLIRLEWMSFIDLIGPAHDAVARFDGLVQSIPNPRVLLSPLTTKEAVLSSKIEGTQATMQEVLEYEADPKETKRTPDIKEVLNYRRAMSQATQKLESIGFTLRLLKDVHETLMYGVRGEEKDAGNFRKKDVYIGSPGNPEGARYVPPTWQTIDSYLSNFEKYINTNEKDVLVQLAIVHAQFEIIHPFSDGNGRMGRLILPLFLNFKKVLSTPMLYLSEYFETHRQEYYHKLQNISDNNEWEEWIRYFLKAVIEQSKNNSEKAKNIQILYEKKKIRVRDLTNSKYSINALDCIFHMPIFNTLQFREISKIPQGSTGRILNDLVEGKVLKILRQGSGQRPTLYIFPKLLDIVDN